MAPPQVLVVWIMESHEAGAVVLAAGSVEGRRLGICAPALIGWIFVAVGGPVKCDEQEKMQKFCMWRGVSAWGCMRLPGHSGG
jgi:hypothetical protein